MTETWIGVAQVHPRPGNGMIGGAIGAFVVVVALAKNQRDFLSLVAGKLASYDFDVIDIAEVQKLVDRKVNGQLNKRIEALAASLSKSNAIALDEFQTYVAE